MVVELPSGTVTFAFVDVVGSTSAFTEHGEAFVESLEQLHAVIAGCAEQHRGAVVKTEGDGAFLAFPDADGAVRALVGLQERVEARAEDPAMPEPRLRVRAGAHTGPATPIAGDYVALPVNVAARVTSAAGAGQALVTPAVVAALTDPHLVHLAAEPMGQFALKDVRGPTPLHRVAGGAEPPRAAPYRRTNVADPITSFVGRAAELEQLRELVSEHRIITIVGPGGMGKTRLASQLLLEIATSYDGGAWLVELASISEPEQVLGQVAAVLGSSATTVEDLAAELAARGTLMVVLDNCEHVIDAAAKVVVDLVRGVPDLVVLATSREALEVEHEVVWRVPPLGGEATLCALFAHRYGASTGMAFDELDRSKVADLCEALDGSPLAIELASVHARELPIDRLVELVREGTDPLARRGGGRQSSLDAVVAWSIDRLDRAHRDALLVLAQAPGRLTFEEAGLLVRGVAEEHSTTTTTLLRGLVRSSLVDLDGNRYRLLDTIRGAARRALRADGDLAPRAREMLHAAAAAMVDPDHDFSLMLQDDPRADRLLLLEEAVLDAWRSRAPGLGEVWMTLGIVSVYLPVSERLRHAARAVLQELPAVREIGADDAYRLTGAHVIVAVDDFAAIGWTPAERSRFVHAVAAGSPSHVAARTACMIGGGLLTESRPEEAAPFVALAADLAERSGSALHRVNAAMAEGFLLAITGDTSASLRATERALRIAPSDYPDRSTLVNNHACTLDDVGRHQEAAALLRGALDRRPGNRDRWGLTVSLAEVLAHAGAHADALAIARSVREELLREPVHGPARIFLRDADRLVEEINDPA